MDLNQKKEKEIMDRYLDLPEDVQKALFSSATSDAIFDVGKKHGLQIDKMGELADETGLVMLGMTKPSEYIKNLEKRLGVEAIKAKEIADSINQKVFSPIRESLKKIHGITPTPPPAGGPPPYKGEGEIRERSPVSQKPPIEKIAPLLDKEGVGGGKTPDNLPIETTLKKIPLPISDKIDQILREHETKKQTHKYVMPEHPADVKTGEMAKEIEPKVEIKPEMSGRITTPPFPPLSKEGKERVVSPPLQGGARGGIPDIFLRNIPNEKPKIIPDFVPPPKPVEPTTQKETKNILEKQINDPYKESVE